MSGIAIVITPPGGSPVDITDDVVFKSTSFAQQMNAVAGQCRVLVRDPNRTLSFETGAEISLEVDGVLMFGGYITSVDMGSFAPAADTSDLDNYYLRTWTLMGVDYNILFDKRVWRNPADYLSFIDLSSFTTDGAILREAVDNYADMSGFDSSGIEDVATISTGDALQQGDKIRKEFESLSLFGGTVWYIAPDKTIIYKPYDNAEKRWGFSDDPNKTPITVSPDEFQGATFAFREVSGSEDISYMVNDALVWGGSEWAGASGSSGGETVFARVTDSASITANHRWQLGETHFGERNYAIQAQVDARANVIVNGPPGADALGQTKGLKAPQWQFDFTWLSEDVPLLSGTPDHIRAGDLVAINLSVFGVTKLLPLRELRIDFPDAFENDSTHLVRFHGTFGLQLSDPFTLWRYLLSAQARVTAALAGSTTLNVVDNTSTSAAYGSLYSGVPSPAPDNTTTVFTIPFGYITGTTQVYLNGLIQRLGTDYTESDEEAGQFTMTSAPLTTDNLIVSALTLES